MTIYRIFAATNDEVGFTTSQAEMLAFRKAHPSYTMVVEENAYILEPRSTLPTLQEDPAKPGGDFLRQ